MMTEHVLTAQNLAAMVSDNVKIEETALLADPGGRMGTYQEAGIFFAPGTTPKGMIWILSEEHWEAESVQGHQKLALDTNINIETFEEEKRLHETGKSAKPVATELSR